MRTETNRGVSISCAATGTSIFHVHLTVSLFLLFYPCYTYREIQRSCNIEENRRGGSRFGDWSPEKCSSEVTWSGRVLCNQVRDGTIFHIYNQIYLISIITWCHAFIETCVDRTHLIMGAQQLTEYRLGLLKIIRNHWAKLQDRFVSKLLHALVLLCAL